MTININFQQISATTISGGGIFIGQNVALGWDAFTKSNTGISNGNHSPIKNSLVIVDDRDCIDAPMIDADHPIAKVKADPPPGDPGDGPIPGRKRIRKDSEGGYNNQLVIKQDGQQVYPQSEPDMKKAASRDIKTMKKAKKNADSPNVKKVQSWRGSHAKKKRKRPRRIHMEK